MNRSVGMALRLALPALPALSAALGLVVAAACGGGGSGGGNGGADSGGSGASSGSSGGSSSGTVGSSSSSGSSSGASSTSSSGSSSGSSGGASSGSSSGGGDAGVCGACPGGFSCDAASGNCKSPLGVPAFGNVYLIVEENHSYATVKTATYIASLIASNAYASNYSDTLVHPSLPNYLGLTSGSTHGVTCDCQAGSAPGGNCPADCNDIESDTCNCVQPTTVANVADEIEAKGLTWHAYGESMTGDCDLVNSTYYVARHIPFVYYDDIQSSSTRCANVVPWTASTFAADLGKYGYSFIAPNLQDDGHTEFGGVNEVTATDDWLSANVPTITGDAQFQKNGVLFITWDEGDDTDAGTTDDHVLLLVISPLAKPGATAVAYDHYSLLGTIEEGLGLATPHLGTAPITDVWK